VKKVFVTYHLPEAHRIRDLLREHGIAAEVSNETLIGAWGEVPMDITTLPTVWIPDESRAAEADALVKELLKPATGDPWTCPRCGETNGAAFTACPTCGGERPA